MSFCRCLFFVSHLPPCDDDAKLENFLSCFAKKDEESLTTCLITSFVCTTTWGFPSETMRLMRDFLVLEEIVFIICFAQLNSFNNLDDSQQGKWFANKVHEAENSQNTVYASVGKTTTRARCYLMLISWEPHMWPFLLLLLSLLLASFFLSSSSTTNTVVRPFTLVLCSPYHRSQEEEFDLIPFHTLRAF